MKQVQFFANVAEQAGKTIQPVYVVTIVAKQNTQLTQSGGIQYQYEVEYEEQNRELLEQGNSYLLGDTQVVYKSPVLDLERCYNPQGDFDYTLIPTQADVVSHKEKVDVESLAKSRVALPRSFMTFSDHIINLIITQMPNTAAFLELKRILSARDGVEYFQFKAVDEDLKRFLDQVPNAATLQKFSAFQSIGTGWGKSFIEMLAGTALGGIICVVPDDTLRLQLVDDYQQIIQDAYPQQEGADTQDPIFTLREQRAVLMRKYADYERQLADLQARADLGEFKVLLIKMQAEVQCLLLARDNQNSVLQRLLKNQDIALESINQIIKQDEFWRKTRSVNPDPQIMLNKECESFRKTLKSLKDLEERVLITQSQIASDTLGFSKEEIKRIIATGTADQKIQLRDHLEKQPFLILTLEELELLEPVLNKQFMLIDEVHQLGAPEKIAFLKRLRERNIFLGLTGTPTLEMFQALPCLYDATVIEAMQAGYLRNVVTEESAGKDYQVEGTPEEACRSAAVNYFGTTVYHRYTTKGHAGERIWNDVTDFYQANSDKVAAVQQAVTTNRQPMDVETNMIFNSDPVAQHSMQMYYQQLAGISGAMPDAPLVAAVRERRIALEAQERQALYSRLSETKQVLHAECSDSLVSVERYYEEVIKPEVMQGRITHLSRGVSATAMSLLFFGCRSDKVNIAANNGAFGVFMHGIIQKHLVKTPQPPEIENHYRKLLAELQDIDAYKAKIREKLNQQLPWENQEHKQRYIDLVCVEIDTIAKLLLANPASIQPQDLTTAPIREEHVRVFDEYYVQVVNQDTQRHTPRGTKQALDGMDLGVTMHIIADKTLATGINKKPLLNVNICITDPHDELLEPALIAQAAGRCIRDDFKQGFCKMVVTQEVEAQFTAHQGQPFTPAKAFSKEFSTHYEQGLSVIATVKRAAAAFRGLLRTRSSSPPSSPTLKSKPKPT